MRLDLRSLAVFRMAMALLLLGQAILLSPDFDAFYGAEGVSLSHGWSESLVASLIFGLLPLFAICLLMGFFTRLVTLLSLVGLVIVQEANPQILQGGDFLLRLLLFWSLFLPLSHTWSVDARFRKPRFISLPWTTYLAGWALTFQICFVYWFAALLKSDPLWTQNGNALFYALDIEHFTTPLGLYVRQFPDFLRALTFGTLCLEIAGPCLLFIPYRRDACRLFAVVFFIGFHLIGMQGLLRIGLFPWVCAAAWLVFIPGSLWDWLGARGKALPKDKKTKTKQEAAVQGKGIASHPAWISLDYGCSALVIAAFLDILAWNIASVGGNASLHWMKQHDVFGNTLRLDQRWNMYAPYPRKEHGWLVIPADLAEGTQVDLFTGQAVSWEKPKDIGAYFGDDRWRRYLSNLFDDRDPQALQGYADYLVGNWNRTHRQEQKIQTVTIVFMKEVTLPDLTITPPEKEVLYFHEF